MPPKKQPKKSKVKIPKTEGNKMSNWYDELPKELIPEYYNPNYDKHLLKIPFRMAIVGASGSGKTTVLLELVKRMSQTFNIIIVCCKSKEEPLYLFLRELIPDPEMLIFFEGGAVPSITEFEGTELQILIVFDDLVSEKDQSAIAQYYIRGRKVSGGISCAYLSQSYFGIPKIIRLQCNYILLKKLGSKKDLKMILSDNSLGIELSDLEQIYSYATDEKGYFLLLDIESPSPDTKFRKGFLEYVKIDEDD